MENYTFLNATETLVENGIKDSARYTIITCYALIALLGIPGNALVIAVVTKLPKRNSTDYYVLSMAIFDLFSSSVNTTCSIIQRLPGVWTLVASVSFCRFNYFLLYATYTSSFLLFAAVAIDRLRRTLSRLPSDSPRAPEQAKRICVAIAVSSTLYSSLAFFPASINPVTLICDLKANNKVRNIQAGILALTFVILIVAVVYSYTRISIILRQNRRKVNPVRCRENRDDIEMKDKVLKRFRSKTNRSSFSKDVTEDEFKLQSIAAKDKSEETPAFHTAHTSKGNSNGVPEERQHSFLKVPMKPVGDSNLMDRYGTGTTNALRKNRIKNHTTLMMFLLTLTYFLTWMCYFVIVVYIYEYEIAVHDLGLLLGRRIFMVNSLTNPLFYMIMSSKFRHRTKALLSRR